MLHKYKTDSKRNWQDKTIIQNPKGIAKEFNNFFTSVGPKLAKKIPNPEKTFQDFLTCHNKTVQFEESKFDKIEEAFKSLKRSKTAGFDN